MRNIQKASKAETIIQQPGKRVTEDGAINPNNCSKP
jgi:hypothetical protein